MARKADQNSNAPDTVDVQSAVKNIEQHYEHLASERGVYMQKCKRIREAMASDYEIAGNRGISKKLLKSIVKERDLERKIDAITVDLEPDERSEREMLVERLGSFAFTPLGEAALAKADGTATLKAVGA